MRNTLRSWLAAASLAGLAWLSGCGGGGDAAPDPVVPPPPTAGATAPVVDSARSASASVGPAGGSVTATASSGITYTLVIPPGALVGDVAITLTPVLDMGSAPLAKNVFGAVQMEPSGLRFRLPATMQIGATPALAAGQRLVGFVSANNGSGFGLAFARVNGGVTELSISHFSTAGAANATAEETALAPLLPEPVAGEVSSDVFVDRMGHLVSDGSSPGELGETLEAWYDQVLRPQIDLTVASGSQAEQFIAIGLLEQWMSVRDLVLTIEPEAAAQLTSQNAHLDANMPGIFKALIASLLAQCRAGASLLDLSLASALQDVAARTGFATVGSGLQRADFLVQANGCLRPVLDPITLPSTLSPGQPVSLDARAQVVFNGQPNPVGAGFEFTITATDATVATPVGLSDGDGRYTTVFTPSTAAPIFDVRACLALNDGSPLGSDICVSQQVGIPFAKPVGTFDGVYVITGRTPKDRFCFNDLLQPRDAIGRQLFTRTSSTTNMRLDDNGAFELNVDPGFGGGQWSGQLRFGPGTFTGQQTSQFGVVLATFTGTFTEDSIQIEIDSPVGEAACTSRFEGKKR